MDTKKPGYRSSRAVAFGADNGARTRDPNLGKVVLYQLSHVRICKTKHGADNGARTRDPNLGKVVLYQLSHVRLRVINLRELSKRRKYFFQKTCLPHVLSS